MAKKQKSHVDIRLAYGRTVDVLTVAFMRQFPPSYGREKATVLARELAEELLRPALGDAARDELDRRAARAQCEKA